MRSIIPFASRVLAPHFPHALWGKEGDRPEIALTFDDGPDPRDTPELLEVLDQYQVKATFFFLGQQLLDAPALIPEVAAAGHQLALHGYRHRPFPLERTRTLQKHLGRTQTLLADASGRGLAQLRDVRPPYGLFTPATLTRLIRWGYRPVMWTVSPYHWQQPAAVTVQEVVGQARNGAILILHEGKSGPAVAALAAEIILRLQADSFRFVTIDDMWRRYRGP